MWRFGMQVDKETLRQLTVYRKGGHPVEQEVLGIPLTDEVCRGVPPRYLAYSEAFMQALSLARDTPWSAHNPNTPLSRHLYAAVKEQLFSQIGKFPTDRLGLWPTHGTAFDYYHGVDAMFIFECRWWVTLDLSLVMKSNVKADFLVMPKRFIEDGYLENLAEDIAGLLIQRREKIEKVKPLFQE